MTKLITYLFLVFSFALRAQGLYVNGTNSGLFVGENSFISIDGSFQNQDCDPVLQVRVAGQMYVTKDFITNDVTRFFPTSITKKSRLVLSTFSSPFVTNISGSVIPQFYEVEINKGMGSYTILFTDVWCSDTLSFKSGFINLQNKKWIMKDPVGAPSILNHPWIKGEKNSAQFLAVSSVDTGMVYYQTVFTNSLNLNPGNIGIKLNGPVDVGSPVIIKRGTKKQQFAAGGSIVKYFDVISPAYGLSNNSLQVDYFLNDQFSPSIDMNNLSVYTSNRMDLFWSRMPSATEVQNVYATPFGPGIFTVNLSDFRLPNMTTDSTAFRITLAVKDCTNPVLSGLSPDTLHLCAGTNTLLNAGYNPVYAGSVLRYDWNTNPPQYTQTINVNPQSTYKKIKLNITDIRACTTRDSIVIAPSAPFPQISYLNHLNACSGDSIVIKDTVRISSGTYNNLWIFSNSDSATTKLNLFKRSFVPGSYSLQLLSTSNYGCSSTASLSSIKVYALPTASFVSALTCPSGAISFSNLSVSNEPSMSITANLWNFGIPAVTSSVSAPVHNYSVAGTYTVQLKSTTAFGCRDSIALPVTVYPRNTAAFLKTNVCNGDSVSFNNTSQCNTGNCQSFWFFGDNSTSTVTSPKKMYPSPGLFTVKLRVTNPNTCADSIQKSVFINARPAASFTLSQSNICPGEIMYATNSSSISAGSISSYTWISNNVMAGNGTNFFTSFSNPGFRKIILIAKSDSGCINAFDADLQVFPKPLAQFSVQNVCASDSVVFISSSSGINLSHNWYFGNNFNSLPDNNFVFKYMYPQDGVFSSTLIVTTADGCSDTSSAPVNVYPMPVAAFQSSVSTCGDVFTIDALNSGCTYLWSPGNDVTQTKTINQTGTYQVIITTSNNCTTNQSTFIKLNSIVTPELGPDTAACGSLWLNAGYPGSTYVWNNSTAAQLLLIKNSGKYVVNVTDQNNCSGTDSIIVSILPSPSVNLGPDIQACLNQGKIILSSTVTGAGNLVWNNGIMQPEITVTAGGHYWLESINGNGCSHRDSIFVTVKNTPEIYLGADHSSCGTTLLDAKNAGKSFSWNDGTVTQTLAASNSGKYWVTVTDPGTQCIAADTILISIFPNVTVNLGPDTTVCSGEALTLASKNDIPGSDYQWSTGATTKNIIPTLSGVYGLTVTSEAGCSGSDFVTTEFLPKPVLEIGDKTRFICGEMPLIITASASNPANWYGATGIISGTHTLTVSEPGKYWATADNGKCNTSDTLIVQVSTKTVEAIFLASTVDTINHAVKFVNLSTPDSIISAWDFGDGFYSNDKDPEHTFILPRNFSVTLQVSNGYCTHQTTKSLDILFRSSNENTPKKPGLGFSELILFPNPGSDFVVLHAELNYPANMSIEITDAAGRKISAYSEISTDYIHRQLDLRQMPAGLYFVNVDSRNERGKLSKTFKLVKTE